MLELVQKELGWPSSEIIFDPPGSGASVVLDLARAKIQQRVRQLEGGRDARVGILTVDPLSSTTQAPVALICEFLYAVPITTLRELHRYAWNFSRTPLLITVEPNRLRAFSCCQQPEQPEADDDGLKAEITEAEYTTNQSSLVGKASALLHWLNLSSGLLQRQYPKRFDRRYSADNSLLENLNAVRERLHVAKNGKSLELDLVHDLLARLIFIQFLFHREDSRGVPALNASYLQRLYEQNIISHPYESLAGILKNHGDTYAFFGYLNDKFNGDLFPGKSESEFEREQEWRREMEQVKSHHLELLSDFVMGEMEISSGQRALWPLYSFDTIPLEFISSIYEAFVTKRKGTVYTPVHLVDFVLDGVLPWDGEEWDIKILDPACGSGIFLVRAFQRLAHRWKNANPGSQIRTDVLKRLLTHNLTGVDIDSHAVRVASFSLYLAMCDELDPRHYWKQIRFPKLRDERLITADFFAEDVEGLSTEKDAKSYDLVVGNPPWGKNQTKAVLQEFGSNAAHEWASEYGWPISYGDSGPLFLAKALKLARSNGLVSLLQPTGTALVNQSGPASKLRKKLFTEHHVLEVTNLSALRFGLFKKAVGPCTLITVCPEVASQDHSISYIVVKPGNSADNDYRFVIDPYDIHQVYASEVAEDPSVWTALTWGGPRDLALLRYLARFPTIASYEDEGALKTRWGVVRGNRKKNQEALVGKKFFSAKDFPSDSILDLSADSVPINDDPATDSGASTDLLPFEPPQLLIKRSWRNELGRFRAVRIVPERGPVYCSNSYITVSAKGGDRQALLSACLAINSRSATYFLLLNSAQLSNYRDTTNVGEILAVPCPPPEKVSLNGVSTFQQIDDMVEAGFELKEAEKVLVDDLFNVTLPYFKGGTNSIARKATQRNKLNEDAELTNYLSWFLRVLRATFGSDKHLCATLFEEFGDHRLPVRLVAIHLDWPERPELTVQPLEEGDLIDKLTALYTSLSGGHSGGPVRFQRVARAFDTIEEGGKKVPTLFIAKPDEKRYWTSSIAMRDADEAAVELLTWRDNQKNME